MFLFSEKYLLPSFILKRTQTHYGLEYHFLHIFLIPNLHLGINFTPSGELNPFRRGSAPLLVCKALTPPGALGEKIGLQAPTQAGYLRTSEVGASLGVANPRPGDSSRRPGGD